MIQTYEERKKNNTLENQLVVPYKKDIYDHLRTAGWWVFGIILIAALVFLITPLGDIKL